MELVAPIPLAWPSLRFVPLVCAECPFLLIKKVFTNDIKNLLSMSDMWKSREPPVALDFDQIADGSFSLPVRNTNTASSSKLSGKVQKNGSSSAPNGANGASSASGLKDQKDLSLQENLVLFVSRYAEILDTRHQIYVLYSTHRLAARLRNGEETISLDKDDDDTLGFVTAASNLRSAAYGIQGKSRWEIKGTFKRL